MTHIEPYENDRPLGAAIAQGLRCNCPACGEMSMFTSYLRVHDRCPNCNEDLSHQRADDGPAYLTMFVCLKLITPFLVSAVMVWNWPPLLAFGVFGCALVALSLFLLPRFKGMIVAIQWSRRMHGFGAAHGAEYDNAR